MLGESKATSGFAVRDMGRAREFYEGTLGLQVEVLDEQYGVAVLHLTNGYDVLMYLSADMTPPSYTILNFEVDDIDAAVEQLGGRGIQLQRY